MWGCMCWTDPSKFRWSRGYIYYTSYHHHHQIGRIDLSHCYHIFPWLCVWGGCSLWSAGRIQLFAHYTTSLPSLCRPIWSYQTVKMLVRHILSHVCLRLGWFSIIFHAIYGAVSIQLTHFSYDNCENTCTWSYYHHQFGRITHLPLFMVKS